MNTVAVLSYKGGVGKTTLTVCTAQALALTGFRVLAVDNDCQHNLSIMLGARASKPTIRDVYHSSIGTGSQILRSAIRKTAVPGLDLVPSTNQLCINDVKDPYLLKKCLEFSGIINTYDHILIDNGPGIDLIQECALHASNRIFVPTALSLFSINGIIEMHNTLSNRFPDDCPISKIIPNFYRDTKRQNVYIDSLAHRFPDMVTKTPIPWDSVFETLSTGRKILFLHRLSSKAAAYYLKLIHDLFDLDETETWNQVMERRREQISLEARRRLEENGTIREKGRFVKGPEQTEERQKTLSNQPEYVEA